MGMPVRNDLQIIHPLEGGFSITPSSNYFPKTRSLYVGANGNVTATMANGSEVTFVGLAAGVFHPLQVIRVTAATATGILGMV